MLSVQDRISCQLGEQEQPLLVSSGVIGDEKDVGDEPVVKDVVGFGKPLNLVENLTRLKDGVRGRDKENRSR